AIDVPRLGLAGNCEGARCALEVINALPDVTTAVLMFTKPLAGVRSRHRAVLRLEALIKKLPGAGALARRLYWFTKRRRARPVMDKVRALSQTANLTLLLGDQYTAGKLLRGAYAIGTASAPTRVES